MKPEFVHHHVHSYNSLLDGLSSPDEISDTIKKLGMRGWSLTDHGNIAGAYEATKAAKAHDLKINIGCELYFTENRHIKSRDRWGQSYYHLVAIATNMVGYKNLIKLQSIGDREGFYRKPRVDFDALQQHHEGIVFTTACLSSHVNQALLSNDIELAKHRLGALADTVGWDNVFVEIQGKLDDEKRILPHQVQLAKDLNLPLLPTGDCHYAHACQADHHDSLLCSSTNKKKTDAGRMKFDSEEYYLHSAEEMHRRFGDETRFPNAMKNTLELLDRCDFVLPTGKDAGHIMPEVKVPKGETEDSELRRRVLEGAAHTSRYGDGRGNIPGEVLERIDYELSVVEKMGFAGYFLLVADIVEMFKNNNIPVGAGRGSAPGSVAVYCLGITNIDPVAMGLFFERFLNPDRISFPDIDIDIPKKLRPKALRLLQKQYGAKSVAHINNFNKMDIRRAIASAAKVHGLSFAEETALKDVVVGDTLKGVSHTPGYMESEGIKSLSVVAEKLKKRKIPQQWQKQILAQPNAQTIIETAAAFEGVIFANGVHACGIVIMPGSVDDYFPIRVVRKKDKTGESETILEVTQFDKDGIEDTGGVKMDVLGLETLDECTDAEHNILCDLGETVDTSNLVPDDKKVFDMLSKGEGSGVFQLSCVSGDTIVDGVTIRDRFHNRKESTYLRSLNLGAGTVETNFCHAVCSTGVKPSLTLTTRAGRTLTMSPEHKILTRRGWVAAQHVIPNVDMVVAVPDGFVTTTTRPAGFTVDQVTRMLLRATQLTQWDGAYRGDDEYRIVLYDSEHNAAYGLCSKSKQYSKILDVREEFAQHHPGVVLHIMHVSEILEHLMGVALSVNATIIPEGTVWDAVCDVSPGEPMEMFDVVMSDPLRSFVANGIVVHNSGGMCNLLKEMKPKSIFDISSALALYRPGPLGEGTHLDFCRRKNGTTPVTENLPHPEMAELLKETYGLIVFQENVMSAAVHFAGYTGAEADHLRKATAKKIPAMMLEEKEKFIPAVNKRYGGGLGEKLWNIIEPFGEYAFNQSHSAAYAVLSYRTAWLKCNYPAQFGAALLDNGGSSDKDKRKNYVSWMKRWGIEIQPPDVNAKTLRSTTTKKSVRLSPLLVQDIGRNMMQPIIEERNTNGPFTSVVDFVARTSVSTKDMTQLIKAGFFDSLHKSRLSLLFNLPRIEAMAAQQKGYSSLSSGLFGEALAQQEGPVEECCFDDDPDGVFMVGDVEYDPSVVTNFELEEETLHISCGRHPYSDYSDFFENVAKTGRFGGLPKISSAEQFVGGEHWFSGVITGVDRKTSKNGSFLIFTISDDEGDVRCLRFKDTTVPLNSLRRQGVLVRGRAEKDRRGNGTIVRVEELRPIRRKR